MSFGFGFSLPTLGWHLSGGGASSGYSVNKSLRFRSSASASLTRTPPAGNRQTWTWSNWVKRGQLGLGSQASFFTTWNASNQYNDIGFNVNDVFHFFNNTSGAVTALYTTAVYRDPAAWYHVILAVDTTQATASDRVKIYINGVQITSFGTATYPAQNSSLQINSAIQHNIGYGQDGGGYFDGEMAEINFIDGYPTGVTSGTWAATNIASSFGAFSAYNQWLPKAYTGTYGTNGFYLPFTNTTSTSTLVADSSPNGNNWTPNNISLTAGSTYDSLTDVPTLTSETVANYAVLNPNANKFGVTIADVNLTTTYYPASTGGPSSTIGVSSGKWYFEFRPTVTIDASAGMGVGIANTPWLASGGWYDAGNQYYVYYFNGSAIGGAYSNGAYTSYSAPLTTSDVAGVAFDLTASTVSFYKNNVLVVTVSIPSGQTWFATSGNGSSGAQSYGAYFNFGQQPFTYTPPTGFLPLNTYNI